METCERVPAETSHAEAMASAVRNYERTLDMQKDTFHSLGDHPKGELLFRLAEEYARLGDRVRARRSFERPLVVDAPAPGRRRGPARG